MRRRTRKTESGNALVDLVAEDDVIQCVRSADEEPQAAPPRARADHRPRMQSCFSFFRDELEKGRSARSRLPAGLVVGRREPAERQSRGRAADDGPFGSYRETAGRRRMGGTLTHPMSRRPSVWQYGARHRFAQHTSHAAAIFARGPAASLDKDTRLVRGVCDGSQVYRLDLVRPADAKSRILKVPRIREVFAPPVVYS